MPLVAAKCTQCGANIEVNPSQDAGICPHCGTAYVTEKVIKNYITNNYTNIGSVNIDTLNVSMPDPVEHTVNSYSAYMKQKEYKKAYLLLRDELDLDSANVVLNLLAYHFSIRCKLESTAEWDHKMEFIPRTTFCDAVTEYKKLIADLKSGKTDVVEPQEVKPVRNYFTGDTIYKYNQVIYELSFKQKEKYSKIVNEVQQEIDAQREFDKLKDEADTLLAPLKLKQAMKEQARQAKKKRTIAILVGVGILLFILFGIVINVIASKLSP